MTNAARAAPEPTKAHQTPPNPRSAPSTSPYVRSPKPTAARTAPGRSSLPLRSGGASLQRPTRASATVAAASGRLRRKIHRQDTHSTSAPPADGPAIVATLVNEVQSPIARPDSAPYTPRRSAREFVVRNAPATP